MQIANARSLHTLTISSDADPSGSVSSLFFTLTAYHELPLLTSLFERDIFVLYRHSDSLITMHCYFLCSRTVSFITATSHFRFHDFRTPQRLSPALYNLDLQAYNPILLQCRQTTVSALHLVPRHRVSRADPLASVTLFPLHEGTPSIWSSLSPTIEQLLALRVTSLLRHHHLRSVT